MTTTDTLSVPQTRTAFSNRAAVLTNVEDDLLSRHPKATSRGEWLDTYSPFRNGDNDHCFSFNRDTGGWVDEVTGDRGNIFVPGDALADCYDLSHPLQPIQLRTEKRIEPLRESKQPEPVLKPTYFYRDANGQPLYGVKRIPLNGGKTFAQCHPDSASPTGWMSGRGNSELVLYRLPEIVNADLSQTVFVVEGEKDADRLAGMGLVATCNVGGAGKWVKNYTETLRGRDVVLCEDNDGPGRAHTELVGAALLGVVKSIKVLRFPELPNKGDITDWLDEHGSSVEKLLELVAQASLYAPHDADSTSMTAGAQDTTEDTQNTIAPRIPLVSLREIAKRPRQPMEYLISANILPAHEATMLFAPEKSFKTFLTLEMAIAIASGRTFLGQHECKRGTVLFLNMEDMLDRLLDRIDPILKREQLTCEDIDDYLLIYDRTELTGNGFELDHDALDQLRQLCIRHRPDLVVIDNLRACLPSSVDENSNSHINPLIRNVIKAVQPSNAALLMIHHTNKGHEIFSGAGSLAGTFANTIKVSRDEDSPTARVQAHRTRNSEGFKSFGIRMSSDGSLMLTDAPMSSKEDQADRTDATIISAIKGHSLLTVRRLVEVTGLSDKAIRNHIKTLVESGTIVEADTPPHGDNAQHYTIAIPNPFAPTEERTDDYGDIITI